MNGAGRKWLIDRPASRTALHEAAHWLSCGLDLHDRSDGLTPLEIANAVVYLASDEASFCTGSTLYADGGWTAR